MDEGSDDKTHNLFVSRPLQKLQVSGATRARVAVMTGLVVLSYVTVVYLIFFLTYTPLDVDHVRGVRDVTFVIILPVAAIFMATVINRELPHGTPAAIALSGSLIAGISTVEALFRAHCAGNLGLLVLGTNAHLEDLGYLPPHAPLSTASPARSRKSMEYGLGILAPQANQFPQIRLGGRGWESLRFNADGKCSSFIFRMRGAAVSRPSF